MLLAIPPRHPELTKRLGVGRSTIYRLIRDGRLAKPVKITGRTGALNQDEVEAHLQRQRVGRSG